MAIFINHRFIDRLLPTTNDLVKVLIIGTFNPGLPDKTLLTISELKEFESIESGKKFKQFNEVKNFYDRPQNRFWKIQDCICNREFYIANDVTVANPHGLKFYMRKGFVRDEVYERQKAYCEKNGIFITDIVKTIRPRSFLSIYDKFPDTAIERSDCDWNTDGILQVLRNNTPNRVIINFKANEKQLPRITHEINLIKHEFANLVVHLYSTSGAAGYTYETLIENWEPHFRNE